MGETLGAKLKLANLAQRQALWESSVERIWAPDHPLREVSQ